MNRRGIFGIDDLTILLFLAVVGGSAYLLTPAGAGSACAFKGCALGYNCQYTGNPLGGFYQCVAQQGVGGEFGQLLTQFSLNSMFCGNAGVLSGFCSISVTAISVIIGAVLGFVAVTLFVAGFGVFGAVIGGIIGLGFASFINYFWWILLGVAGALYYLTKK